MTPTVFPKLNISYLDYAITNHPAHIINDNNQLSPSAFIPFCDFGGNMSEVGVKIDQFDVPVCNIFKEKNLYGQLCYEADLRRLEIKNMIEKTESLRLGFNFVMDYNEDRQAIFHKYTGCLQESIQKK